MELERPFKAEALLLVLIFELVALQTSKNLSSMAQDWTQSISIHEIEPNTSFLAERSPPPRLSAPRLHRDTG